MLLLSMKNKESNLERRIKDEPIDEQWPSFETNAAQLEALVQPEADKKTGLQISHDTVSRSRSISDYATSAYSNYGNAVKSALVDSAAGIAFYTPIMGLYETLIAGYSISESAAIRSQAAILGIGLYAAYGKYRDWVLMTTGTKPESSKRKKAIVETAASYLFNAAAYFGILAANGTKPMQALGTALGGTVLVGISGRPYGWFLDKMRNHFSTKS